MSSHGVLSSWFFLPFIFIGLSFGVGHLSSMSSSNSSRIAVVTDNAQIKEVLKDIKNLDFDYKDEAAAKKAIKTVMSGVFAAIRSKRSN